MKATPSPPALRDLHSGHASCLNQPVFAAVPGAGASALAGFSYGAIA